MIARCTQALLSAFAFSALSCATLGTESTGTQNLPSALVGPFRPLSSDEVAGESPTVFSNKNARYTDPSAILLPDGSVALYAVTHDDAGNGRIVRTRSTDGRGFVGSSSSRAPLDVLRPTLPWEGVSLGNPEVFGRKSGGIRMYYAAGSVDALALGVADGDGATFRKHTDALLMLPADALGFGASEDPAGVTHVVVARPPGLFEAMSADGLVFGAFEGPILTAPADTTLQEPALTWDQVEGRSFLRVWFTEKSAIHTVIRFASRESNRGPLIESSSVMYSVSRGEHAPSVLRVKGRGFLYVTQTTRSDYPAIGAGVCPPLPALGPFADEPDSP